MSFISINVQRLCKLDNLVGLAFGTEGMSKFRGVQEVKIGIYNSQQLKWHASDFKCTQCIFGNEGSNDPQTQAWGTWKQMPRFLVSI